MTDDSDIEGDNEAPANARERVREYLKLHNRFWNQMTDEIGQPGGENRLHAVCAASAFTLGNAVALAWVAREYGPERADELARVTQQYVDNGEDYDGLFEEDESYVDTGLTLIVTQPPATKDTPDA